MAGSSRRTMAGDASTRAFSGRKVFSDAVVADFPVWRNPDRAVLTVYRPYPYDEGRGDLLSVNYGDMDADVRRSVLDMFGPHGLIAADIEDVRISRWGHPMIVARPWSWRIAACCAVTS